MPRLWLLVCLLLLIVFTSQFEWNQQYGNALEASLSTSQKLKHTESDDPMKEKIILSQEKSIQKLNKLVQSLREQLLQCKGESEGSNTTTITETRGVTELERQPVLEN